jgi:plastocyanin
VEAVTVRRSVMRVLVAVGVVAAGGLPWTEVLGATGHDINVTGDAAKCDKTWGPPCFTPANGTVTSVAVGDTVTWHVLDGTHTVTPVDPAAFGGSGDLTGPEGTFSASFDKPGTYTFYCKHHGAVDKDGKTFHGMWGKIEVKGPDSTTTSAPPPAAGPPSSGPPPGPPPPPPPSGSHPPPTSSSAPPPSSSGGSGGGNGQSAADLHQPWVGPPITQPPPSAPPGTRTAAGQSSGSNQDQAPPSSPSGGKGNGSGREGNGNANSGPAYVPPDSALVPPIPAFATPTTRPLAGTPSGVPQGDAVAVLKHEPGGKHRTLVLLVTGFGVGAFAFGVGGWKYAHRASKYWPA